MSTQNYFKVKNGLEFPSIETLQTTDNGGPSIKPSLNLDFAKTKQLDPRITFSRASTATYYDTKTSAKSESNLFLQSQAFSVSPWAYNRSAVVDNFTTAPDGTTTAAKLTQVSGQTTIGGMSQSINWQAGSTYTISIYAKKVNKNFIMFQTSADAVGAPNRTWFNIDSGYVGTTGSTVKNATIVSLPNGWYRCAITITATVTSTLNVDIYHADIDGSINVINATDVTYFWGAQVEEHSSMTTYVPTTTSAITNYVPVLQTAALGSARFDSDPVTGESKGLLIEESRTNLATFSEQLDISWTSVGITVYPNCALAPDGTYTADKLVGSGSGSKVIYKAFTSGTLTASAYVKAVGVSGFVLSVGTCGTLFNLSTGSVRSYYTASPTASTITPVGNGWYRCSITFTTVGGDNLYIGPNNNVADTLGSGWTGDGVNGIYVWGLQVEAGSIATSYIPTSVTYSGRGSTATYRSTSGVIRTAQPHVARYEPNAVGGNNLLLEASITNALTYTNDFTSWTTQNAAASYNAATAPDGSSQAIKVTTTAATAYLYKTYTASALTYTTSVFAKSGTATSFRLDAVTSGFTAGASCTFDLSAGTAGTITHYGSSTGYIASITNIGGGWYRCSITGSASATTWYCELMMPTSGTSVYFWGAQVEAGSTTTSYVPSVETHSGRSSTGTYYDAGGIIRTASSGQARYTYNPGNLYATPKLLLEPAATNLIANTGLATSSVANAGGTNWTINATTALDGNNTATLFSSVAPYNWYQTGYTVSNSTVYTASIYAKAGSGTSLTWGFDQGMGGFGVGYFTLSGAGSVTPATGVVTAAINYVGNGWYRCSVTGTTTTTSVVMHCGGNGVYGWGAQLELGNAPTSVIVTSGATATRAADTSTSTSGYRAADIYSSSQVTRASDSALITGNNFSSWYKQDQGTLYAEAVSSNGAHNDAGYGHIVSILTNAALSSYYFMTRDGRSGSAYRFGSTQFDTTTSLSSWSNASTSKLALGIQSNNFSAVVNGTNVYNNTTSLTTPVDRMGIGSWDGVDTKFFLNGTIKKIAFYPKRLTNAELISITS